ncbi:small ribosomal subunit protein mS39 [Phymastichus coffea]|uniref:small ribosomal subunit protein mS39 n=1 Tax=Phymastichus coffea TaxID=108790 RepID=UPI00273BA808|nr:small ribosomal subunit protein mS39 [Phymastichus coffea]
MNTLMTRIIDRTTIRNAVLKLSSLSSSSAASSAKKKIEIQIPTRIERGPTDILKALDSTIQRDTNSAEYKYIDDPYLIPTSLSKKRTFSLAKESGKKAAMWVLEEHADLLKSNLSEPLVKAFLPPEKFMNKNEVTEDTIYELINQGQFSQAYKVYTMLENDVSKQTKQAILELLCFYNSKLDQIPEKFLEERSYQVEDGKRHSKWKSSPEVEKLFAELSQDKATVSAAYNAVICGTAKYMKFDVAYNYYDKCLVDNIPLSVTSFNYIMQLVPLLKDSTDTRKILIQSILNTMMKRNVMPNLQTLNAALYSISVIQSQEAAKQLAKELLAEFKLIGIKPSLGSYYYLLQIFYRPSGPGSSILLEILAELEKKEELEIRDVADINFFVHAMEVALQHMHDLDAGHRLHKLLVTKNNYRLIGGRLKESVYYRNYLLLILSSMSFDEFMGIYNRLVPHIYIPEPGVMREILEMLEINGKDIAMEFLPKFLSQIIQFDMLDRHMIMKVAFKLMCSHKIIPENYPNLQQQYANFAWTLWTHIEEVSTYRLQRQLWPADIFGYMAVLLLRNNEFEKMLKVLNFLAESRDGVIGTIQSKLLEEIFECCIVRGHVIGALDAVKYAENFGILDVNSMVETIKKSLPMSQSQEKQLINIVGAGK